MRSRSIPNALKLQANIIDDIIEGTKKMIIINDKANGENFLTKIDEYVEHF